MHIIIFILIALGDLPSQEHFTEEWKKSHECEYNYATQIYEYEQYTEIEGGVIIEDGIDPSNCR